MLARIATKSSCRRANRSFAAGLLYRLLLCLDPRNLTGSRTGSARSGDSPPSAASWHHSYAQRFDAGHADAGTSALAKTGLSSALFSGASRLDRSLLAPSSAPLPAESPAPAAMADHT